MQKGKSSEKSEYVVKEKETERMRGRVSECSQGARYSHLFILMEWFVSSGKLIILPRAEVQNEGTNLINL